MVIMWHPEVQQMPEMVLGQWNDKVQTLPSQRAQEPFAQRVRLRCLRRRFQYSQPQVVDTLVELLGENTIPVMQQKAVRVVSRNRFTQLLERPVGGGVRCDIAMQDLARRVFHDHKDIEEAKGRRDHDTKITRHDRLGVVLQKRPPALCSDALAWTRSAALRQVLPYGAWRDPKTQLQ
jgi:hypothetical protein